MQRFTRLPVALVLGLLVTPRLGAGQGGQQIIITSIPFMCCWGATSSPSMP